VFETPAAQPASVNGRHHQRPVAGGRLPAGGTLTRCRPGGAWPTSANATSANLFRIRVVAGAATTTEFN
jgi:hypothetical protein